MSNLCLTSSVHNHSNLCDGQSSLQEMAVAAWKQGVTTLGFTGHSHAPCDLEYCVRPLQGRDHPPEGPVCGQDGCAVRH